MTKYYQARTQPRHSPALNQGTKHVRKRMYFLPEGPQSVLRSDSELRFDTRSEQVALVNYNLRLKTKERHFLAPEAAQVTSLAYTHRLRTCSPSSHCTMELYFKIMTLHLSS